MYLIHSKASFSLSLSFCLTLSLFLCLFPVCFSLSLSLCLFLSLSTKCLLMLENCFIQIVIFLLLSAKAGLRIFFIVTSCVCVLLIFFFKFLLKILTRFTLYYIAPLKVVITKYHCKQIDLWQKNIVYINLQFVKLLTNFLLVCCLLQT